MREAGDGVQRPGSDVDSRSIDEAERGETRAARWNRNNCSPKPRQQVFASEHRRSAATDPADNVAAGRVCLWATRGGLHAADQWSCNTAPFPAHPTACTCTQCVQGRQRKAYCNLETCCSKLMGKMSFGRLRLMWLICCLGRRVCTCVPACRHVSESACTCMHACMHACILFIIHAYMELYLMYVSISYMQTCIHACMYDAYMHACRSYMHACNYVCMYVRMYVHTRTNTHTCFRPALSCLLCSR